MKSIVYDKAFYFSVKVYNLFRYLNEDKKEFIMAKQILRSGTSIGANIKEAQEAQSKADFIAKLSIALKEASETEYWIDLLKAVNLIDNKIASSLKENCIELIKMLKSIIKTTKQNNLSELKTKTQ